MQMARTLKDSFWNSIECVTYRQKKDEELLKFLVLFSWQALHLWTQMRFYFVDMPRIARLDIFALLQIRYVFASLNLDMI